MRKNNECLGQITAREHHTYALCGRLLREITETSLVIFSELAFNGLNHNLALSTKRNFGLEAFISLVEGRLRQHEEIS